MGSSPGQGAKKKLYRREEGKKASRGGLRQPADKAQQEERREKSRMLDKKTIRGTKWRRPARQTESEQEKRPRRITDGQKRDEEDWGKLIWRKNQWTY